MKVGYYIFSSLFMAVLMLPAFTLAENPTPINSEKDTLIRSDQRIFFGKKYFVSHRHSDDWLDYMVIRRDNHRGDIVFEHDLVIYDAGNCNVRRNSVSEYEFKRDSLFFYTYTEIIELWDVMNPVYYYYAFKEVYVVRRTGEFVRVRYIDGKKDPRVKEEIELRLNEKLMNLNLR